MRGPLPDPWPQDAGKPILLRDLQSLGHRAAILHGTIGIRVPTSPAGLRVWFWQDPSESGRQHHTMTVLEQTKTSHRFPGAWDLPGSPEVRASRPTRLPGSGSRRARRGCWLLVSTARDSDDDYLEAIPDRPPGEPMAFGGLWRAGA